MVGHAGGARMRVRIAKSRQGMPTVCSCPLCTRKSAILASLDGLDTQAATLVSTGCQASAPRSSGNRPGTGGGVTVTDSLLAAAEHGRISGGGMLSGPGQAVAVLVEWEGVTAEQYDEMINRMSVTDVALPGSLVHVAGPTENGWRVFDVWESLRQPTASAAER
jgi:hypothetical protein